VGPGLTVVVGFKVGGGVVALAEELEEGPAVGAEVEVGAGVVVGAPVVVGAAVEVGAEVEEEELIVEVA
jgi:serine acetyltransferase